MDLATIVVELAALKVDTVYNGGFSSGYNGGLLWL